MDLEVGPPDTSVEQAAESITKTTDRRDGFAAIFAATSFVVGFVLFSTTLVDLTDDDITSKEELQVIKDNERAYYASNILLYIFFGLAQLVLSVGIAQSSAGIFPSVAPISQALGIIWSTLVLSAGMVGNVGATKALELIKSNPEDAASLWKAIRTIHSGLGGSNEIVGGIWVLSTALLQYTARKKAQNSSFLDQGLLAIAIVAGCAGILSTVPAFADVATMAFGVSMIVWYTLFGIVSIFRGSS